MNRTVHFELEETKKRLDYYLHLKEKTKATKKSSPVLKWVEIYTERLEKLQKQAKKIAKLEAASTLMQ